MEKDNFITKAAIYFTNNFRISLLFLVSLVLIGGYVYSSVLNKEGFPEVQVPIAVVTVPYNVSDKNLINQQITEPIETQLISIEDVKSVRSNTLDNFVNIIVEFNEGVDSEEGAESIQEKLDSLESQLPDNVKPEVITIKASQFFGKYSMLISLTSDENISSEELQQKAESVSKMLEETDAVSLAEPIKLVDEVTNPITGATGKKQIEFNRVGTKEDGKIVFKKAITIGIVKKNKDISDISLSENVREKVSELEENGDIKGFNIFYTADFATSVNENISSLEKNAVDAIIAVLVVLFIFINWRSALVTAIFMPAVMGGTMIVLYLLGYSLNIISLFALVLVLGLFVDDGIVIVEAINYEKNKGVKGIKAITNAVNKVGTADILGTLTTLLVFTPLLFVSGLLGDFIILIPVTVIASLAVSLILALTIIPFLSNLILSKEDNNFENNWLYKLAGKNPNLKILVLNLLRSKHWILNGPNILIGKIGEAMSNFVNYYLKYPLIALLIIIPSTVGLILFGLNTANKLTFSIFPPSKDTNELSVSITYPFFKDIKTQTPYTIEDAENVAKQVESRVLEIAENEVINYYYISANERAASIQIELTDFSERDITSLELVDKLNKQFENFQGADVKVSQVDVGPPVEDYQYKLQIYGSNVQDTQKLSEDIQNFAKTIEFEDDISIVDTKTDFTNIISKIDGRRYVELQIKLSKADSGVLNDITLKIQEKYTEDVLLKYNLDENSLGFDLGQESENAESFESVVFALIIAIIIMYAMLVFQFNSFSQPLLILLAIPLTLPGLFPGLFLTNNALSFFVFLGITGLVGIVVNNTIMLVDYTNQLIKEGKTIRQAIVESVRVRFRPIMTTSTTTIVGILPLALSEPFWEGLAYTLIFGLISSTVLVILAFPAIYSLFEFVRIIRDTIAIKFKNKPIPVAYSESKQTLKYVRKRLLGPVN